MPRLYSAVMKRNTSVRRAALVTGAGQRIGKALALALAEDGWFVFVHYNRSAGEAQQTVAQIRAAGGAAKGVRGNLASAGAAAALVSRCTAPATALTCIVNNASLFVLDRLDTVTAQSFDRHMAINLRAPLLVAQAFARGLPADETGVIVNVLDQKLWNLNPDFLSYTLSKIGLQGLTTLLAQALAPRVRVAGIAPGLTLRSGSQSDARFAQQHTANPLGVGVTPAHLVGALRFILSTPSYTGDTVVIDSGEHLTARPRDIAFDGRKRRGRQR